MKKLIFFAALFVALMFTSCFSTLACTSAIITGKATKDGRPLMWKHRDTGELNNRIEYFKGDKYTFIGLVNSPSIGGEVWTGTNSAGFSIMNTASYNLKNDNVKEMDKEGEVMYKALGSCKNLKDFEKMLDKMERPIRVEANFGVIDTEGGAAYYEVNNTSWTKLDVNDPKIAPQGYLVVTNFSYTGRLNEGMGYIRYLNAREIFLQKDMTLDITPEWIFSSLSRSFYHSLLGIDLAKDLTKVAPNGWFIDQDFIPRKSSSASVVIQGVKEREDPANTIMWTILGYPPLAVAVPLFEKMGKDLPEYVIKSQNSDNCELCDLSLSLKEEIFPIKRGNGAKYFNAALLFNNEGTGYTQQIQMVEGEIFYKFEPIMESIRSNGFDKRELDNFYSEISDLIRMFYDTVCSVLM